MQDIVDNPTDAVNVDNIKDAFNYYIYKIGDTPSNLFVCRIGRAETR